MDFEKSIARHFRMKFGSIGEKLWMNELPIIDGDNAIDAQEFADHAQEVLEAIGYSQPQKYALFKPRNSGFWEVDWHVKWREREYSRMYDVVAMRCRGQAAITLEALPRDKAPLLRKHLMKKYGGASADVRRREKILMLGCRRNLALRLFLRESIWRINLIDSKLSGFNSPSCVPLNTERIMSMLKNLIW